MIFDHEIWSAIVLLVLILLVVLPRSWFDWILGAEEDDDEDVVI